MRVKLSYQDRQITKFIIQSPKYGNFEIIIDTEDWTRVKQYSWFIVNNNDYFYARTKQNIALHRLVLNLTDSKIKVDHADHDTLNNKKSNLRKCTNVGNTRNAKKHKDGWIPYKGVTYDKNRISYRKYVARIIVNYKQIHLGMYKTPEQAALAYNKAAMKYFGEFAYLNEVKQVERMSAK